MRRLAKLIVFVLVLWAVLLSLLCPYVRDAKRMRNRHFVPVCARW